MKAQDTKVSVTLTVGEWRAVRAALGDRAIMSAADKAEGRTTAQAHEELFGLLRYIDTTIERKIR